MSTVYLVVVERTDGRKGVVSEDVNHGFMGTMREEVFSKEQAERVLESRRNYHRHEKNFKSIYIKEVEL